MLGKNKKMNDRFNLLWFSLDMWFYYLHDLLFVHANWVLRWTCYFWYFIAVLVVYNYIKMCIK